MTLHPKEAIDNPSSVLSNQSALQLYKSSSNSSMELHKVNYEIRSGREPKLPAAIINHGNFSRETFREYFPFQKFLPERWRKTKASESKKHNQRRRRVYETRVCKTLHILETTLNMNVVCFFWHWWLSKRNCCHEVFSEKAEARLVMKLPSK